VGYVIAAYALGVGGVIFYASMLARERRELRRRLSQGGQSNPG